MAKKKKQEEAPGGSPLWMNTFADLMNLLLCFFVLLFAMSTVEESKFNELAASLSSAFSIFEDSGTSFFEGGESIFAGTRQLEELDQMLQDMGQADEEAEEQYREILEAILETETDPVEAFEYINQQYTEELYDEFSEKVSGSNLDGYLTYSIDADGQRFIDINVDGYLLFDSGQVEIKDENLPIISKIGDIISDFEGYKIEIIGHTDNVPIHTVRFPSNMELSSARASTVALYLSESKGMDLKNITWSGNAQYNPVDTNDTVEGRERNRRIEIRIYNEINS